MVLAGLLTPNDLLKLIPHANGTPRICEPVHYFLKDIAHDDLA